MKRKYYLRGLGIGILVTALVFIIAAPSKMSDEEIIKRAEELGYVKADDEDSSMGIKDLLEDGTPTPTRAVHTVNTPVPKDPSEPPVPNEDPGVGPTTPPQETLVPTPTEEPWDTPEPTPTVTLMPTPIPTEIPTPTLEPTPTPQPTKAPETEVVTATIVVERGNSATIVCNKMEEAGIIEDAGEFRRYLVQQELTDFINIGTYTLSSDMNYEELAKLLTGR